MGTPHAQPIKIAILAMGGEGGGVLADWIVDLAEHQGHIAQTTSVAGVAQRTGATIYYLELFPRAAAEAAGAEPVLALIPTPGDVDVLLASELMEAGRALQRGLVTPDRTTLIASTHRVYAIAEKSAMGDGRADAAQMEAACEAAAQRFLRFDMAAAAERNNSVISAVLFGALCGSGVLPFGREAFEDTIKRGGVGIQASLAAFAEGAALAVAGPARAAAEAMPKPLPATHPNAAIQSLLQRLQTQFAPAQHALLAEGLRRLVDYQDASYAALYLDRIQAIAAHGDPLLCSETARHLALWMSYEDTVRVADLKTRATRFERVRGEVRVNDQQLLQISEFMHPRLQEICETLPASLGRWLQNSGAPRAWIERFTAKGRIVQTSRLSGFLLLYTLAGLRRWRRGSLRYALENARIEAWLRAIHAVAPSDPALAVEIARCQRLVKGYSDTYERGLRNFERVMSAAPRLASRADAAPALSRLREAALADEHGKALDSAWAAAAL
jgi:indolepyruvate ferredoxin oxidoreductase beta subunit